MYSNGSSIYFGDSSNDNQVSRLISHSNGDDGVDLDNSSRNILRDIVTVNNASDGILINGNSEDNIAVNIVAANNGGDGLDIYGPATRTRITNIIATNNGGTGLLIDDTSDNVFVNVTTSHNYSNGIGLLNNARRNLIVNAVGVSNHVDGVGFWEPSDNTLADLASAHNAHGGISLGHAWNNVFTGLLKVGNNGGSDCYGAPGFGLLSDCTNDDASDAQLTTGIGLAQSFYGELPVEDSVNTSDTGITVGYEEIDDWSGFENPHRTWGRNGVGMTPVPQGRCTAGAVCQGWDWRLLNGDTGDGGSPALHNILPLPDGNDTITHTWLDTSNVTFLRHAVEILDDGIGNDDLLCESGETCLFTPNLGRYQGHGTLVNAGNIGTGATQENITLVKYAANGIEAPPPPALARKSIRV